MNKGGNKKEKKEDEQNKEQVLKGFEKALMDEAPDACGECGGEVKFERVNLEDFEGGKLYVIDDVPAFVCQECGEIWVPKPFLDEFEKMIETVKKSRKEKKRKQ